MPFRTDPQVNVVVDQMYNAFAEGRLAAEQQIEHSRQQSANANNDWREVRQQDPPEGGLLVNFCPSSRSLRANDALRLPDIPDDVRVRPGAAKIMDRTSSNESSSKVAVALSEWLGLASRLRPQHHEPLQSILLSKR